MDIQLLFSFLFKKDDDAERLFFNHFHPVFPEKQQQGGLLTTFPGSTVMECMLRCSRITDCSSVAIVVINTGRSSRGYCQLYRAPFEESLDRKSQHEDKQYYNKDKLV